MGAAVPVAEPQWSGAHQGLALFLGRLLAPLGDRPMAAPVDGRRPDGMLGPTLPAAALQVSTGISYSCCCKGWVNAASAHCGASSCVALAEHTLMEQPQEPSSCLGLCPMQKC